MDTESANHKIKVRIKNKKPKAFPKEYKRLVLRLEPLNLRAHRNIESWSVIEAILKAYGGAYYEDLVAAVSQHRHPSGGKGFVDYCLAHGWLTEYRWIVKYRDGQMVKFRGE